MAEKEQNEPKIGTGHASAMFRQGLRELRAALYPESNVAQPPEVGLYGTRTQAEITNERGIVDRDFDEINRDELAEDRQREMEQDRDDRDIDLER
jgi:hypothetical protein